MNNLIITSKMEEIRRKDTSFCSESPLFFKIKYSQNEVREIYLNAIEYGLEIGFNTAPIMGSVIDRNRCSGKQHEFIDKFYALCGEYNCRISFHPQHGMIITDLTHNL